MVVVQSCASVSHFFGRGTAGRLVVRSQSVPQQDRVETEEDLPAKSTIPCRLAGIYQSTLMQTNTMTLHADRAVFTAPNLHIIGNHNVVGGAGCKVTGDTNRVHGANCTVVGHSNVVQGMFSRVIGNYNTITGRDCLAEGNYNQLSGRRCSARGNHNELTGHHSHAFGNANTLSGQDCYAEGRFNRVLNLTNQSASSSSRDESLTPSPEPEMIEDSFSSSDYDLVVREPITSTREQTQDISNDLDVVVQRHEENNIANGRERHHHHNDDDNQDSDTLIAWMLAADEGTIPVAAARPAIIPQPLQRSERISTLFLPRSARIARISDALGGQQQQQQRQQQRQQSLDNTDTLQVVRSSFARRVVDYPSLADQAHDCVAAAGAAVCVVCQENAPICIALPCRHMAYCVHCARTLCLDPLTQRARLVGTVVCSKCRRPVKEIGRVYFE